MDEVTQGILAVLRFIAPEFGEREEAELVEIIDLHRPLVSAKKSGQFYERAVALLVAHILTMRDEIKSEGAISTANTVASEKEGDLQRSYATSTDDSIYNRTIYGNEFLELRKMFTVSVVMRDV